MTASQVHARRLSGAQIVVEYLVRQGVPYAVGIPGHGSWSLTDALLDRTDIRAIQVIHEQSAVHLADGYYRATGRPAVLGVLAQRDYAGWLMVEQDSCCGPPAESAAIGRRVLAQELRRLGSGRTPSAAGR